MARWNEILGAGLMEAGSPGSYAKMQAVKESKAEREALEAYRNFTKKAKMLELGMKKRESSKTLGLKKAELRFDEDKMAAEMGYSRQQPRVIANMMGKPVMDTQTKQGMQLGPQGLNIGQGQFQPNPMLMKMIMQQSRGKMTLSGAMSMLSDPMKARQVKMQYPEWFAEAEKMVKDYLGGFSGESEDLGIDSIMDTNW